MTTAGRYASRSLLGHVALTLFGFVAFMLLLEMMNRGDEVVARHGQSVAALVKYAALRLPDLTSFILPFAVLIATLLMLAKFARNNEIMALKASGFSFYHLLLSLVPVALLVGLLHFLIGDQVVPRTSQALREWDASAEAGMTVVGRTVDSAAAGAGSRPATRIPPRDEAIWVRDGESNVRIEAVLAEGTELRGVTVFKRTADAMLNERLLADRAVYDGVGWRLLNVQRLSLGDGPARSLVHVPVLAWETSLTPGHLADLAADPATLSLADVWRYVSSPDVGNRPVDFYETWFLRKMAVPLVTLMMVLLAAPVAQGLQRHGGLGAGLAVGVGLGFLYFVADGLLLTLGEIGSVPPLVAAWSPTVLFGALGTAALLKIEGY
jgi:lipopolysaccharide export system permease protein